MIKVIGIYLLFFGWILLSLFAKEIDNTASLISSYFGVWLALMLLSANYSNKSGEEVSFFTFLYRNMKLFNVSILIFYVIATIFL